MEEQKKGFPCNNVHVTITEGDISSYEWYDEKDYAAYDGTLAQVAAKFCQIAYETIVAMRERGVATIQIDLKWYPKKSKE